MSSEGDTSTQRGAKEPKLDCYAILGVHPNAEDVVIRAAFKALAQRYHPDRFSGSKDEAHRRMSDLTHAYEILCDPVRRGKYDRRRRLKAHTATFHLKDATREEAPATAAASPIAAAARHRRYRQAVWALVGAVVVLSAFNLYQYSGRLKGWMGSAPPAASSSAPSRGAAEAPIPIVSGDAPQELTPLRPRTAPIAPTATTRTIMTGNPTGEMTAPATTALDAPAGTPLARTPSRSVPPDASRSAAAPTPAATPAQPPRKDASAQQVFGSGRSPGTAQAPTAASTPPPAATPSSSAATTSPPVASATPPVAPAKAAAPKSSAAAADSLGVVRVGACTDAVIALGLCKTDTTAKSETAVKVQ